MELPGGECVNLDDWAASASQSSQAKAETVLEINSVTNRNGSFYWTMKGTFENKSNAHVRNPQFSLTGPGVSCFQS